MNKLKFCLFLIFVFFSSFSSCLCQEEEDTIMYEEKYLIGDSINFDGLIELDFDFTSLVGNFAVFSRAAGAVTIGRHFLFGGYFSALIDRTYMERDPYMGKVLNFTYGGFLIGLVLMPDKKIKMQLTTEAGFGGLSLSTEESKIYRKETYDPVSIYRFSVEANYRMNRLIDVGIGVNYRIIGGLDLENYSTDDFASPGVFFNIKLCRFSSSNNSVVAKDSFEE